MKTKILSTVAVALLLVTAGCAGLVGDPNETGIPGSDETTQPASTDARMEGADAVSTASGQGSLRSNAAVSGATPSDRGGAEFQQPTVQPARDVGNYTELYDETINSVVEIRVETSQGQGQGSGFVYTDDGYVITNQHVVSGADEVSVGFASGVWRTGEVVGTDVYTDLAVVQVDSLPDSSTPLALAADNPEPGQPVAAIGSPLGFQGSITQGIVSGTNRSMPVAQGFSIPDTVQTDAAINPGNSGGPLVSMDATVLGVNRATAGDNIGFAISADVVREVVPHLVENGSYNHSYMGIRTVPVTPDVAAANDLNRTGGILVAGILQGGPAAGVLQPAERQAGPEGQPVFVGGDVIVGIDNRTITTQHDLARYLLLQTQPGEQIQVTVLRDGERVTETLTLGERPAPRQSGV